jgi:predicted transcriptional regulator
MTDDLKAFTVRVPRELVDQIDARAKFNHRKRNGEINVLLEMAIDASVKSDLQVLKRISDPSQSE